MANDDPRCPECGEPIGQTATYCMHCSADLTGERETADVDGDGRWDDTTPSTEATTHATTDPAPGHGGAGNGKGSRNAERADTPPGGRTGGGELLDPDGMVDDSLTVVVGIAGGIVIGLVGTIVLVAVTGSLWALAFGFVAWLAATAYLVRRRTVQGAVSRSAYGVSLVLLLIPVVALSPLMDGGIGARGGAFVGLLLTVSFPAGMIAAVGWAASRFIPKNPGE